MVLCKFTLFIKEIYLIKKRGALDQSQKIAIRSGALALVFVIGLLESAEHRHEAHVVQHCLSLAGEPALLQHAVTKAEVVVQDQSALAEVRRERNDRSAGRWVHPFRKTEHNLCFIFFIFICVCVCVC